MEDEHVCIDNLREHLGASDDFPCLAAFYGVIFFKNSESANLASQYVVRFSKSEGRVGKLGLYDTIFGMRLDFLTNLQSHMLPAAPLK